MGWVDGRKSNRNRGGEKEREIGGRVGTQYVRDAGSLRYDFVIDTYMIQSIYDECCVLGKKVLFLG